MLKQALGVGVRHTHKTVLGVLLAVLACGLPVVAAQHPVPIEKDTDCATCHENKTQGKAVHSAIAMGCTSCHEVRVNRGVTRVKLITTTSYALCLTCHGDKDASKINGKVHSPAVRDCVKCHDPHTSDNKNQLLKPASGSGKTDNLCLSCHTQGMNVPGKGSRHAALDMGCDTCHTTHRTGEKGKREFDFHLTKASPALCLDCHDAKAENLNKAHQNQPFAGVDCVACHDPHQSASPKLMQRFTHPPFAEKSCETCHAPAKDGKVALTQEAKSLCVTCHDEQAKNIETAKFPHAGAQGDCTDCHNPHASKAPGLPKTDPVNICLGCHSDQAELLRKKVHHQPAFEQGCASCHEPHGGERAKLLRAEGNALCLECHGTKAKPAKLQGEHLLTIFGGKVRLPDDYFAKNQAPRFEIKFGLGHPIANHPVEDVRDPLDQTKIKAQINCLTCHQPHAGAARAMLIKDAKPGLQFCRDCHKGMIGTGVPEQ